eukprot:3724284-Amphidinium_carterae.1
MGWSDESNTPCNSLIECWYLTLEPNAHETVIDNIGKVPIFNKCVTSKKLEYVVETLGKFESQFQLRLRTSAGDSDSFGKIDELSPQAMKEYEHAVKENLNLAGIAGSLNWLAFEKSSRHSLVYVQSGETGYQTDSCRLPLVQTNRTIPEMDDGSGFTIPATG